MTRATGGDVPRITYLAWAAIALAGTLAALGLMSADAGRTSAQSATSLAIDVGDSSDCAEIDEGDEIVVQLVIENVEDLHHWEVVLVFDRDVLEIIGRDAALFLAEEPNSNATVSLEPLPDYNGRHFLGAVDVSSAAESGDGVLAEITFEAVGEGVSEIDIPQFDINSDGVTDEGARLEQAGAFIGDVNTDGFFDGPVEPATVAVEADCGSLETDEPTDPPTPIPATEPPASDDPAPAGSGGPDGPTNTLDVDPPASGASTDGPGGTTDGPGGTGEASVAAETDADQPGGPPAEGGDGGNDGPGAADDGGSFPMWLFAGLLVGGLAIGAVVVTVAFRRSASGAL